VCFCSRCPKSFQQNLSGKQYRDASASQTRRQHDATFVDKPPANGEKRTFNSGHSSIFTSGVSEPWWFFVIPTPIRKACIGLSTPRRESLAASVLPRVRWENRGICANRENALNSGVNSIFWMVGVVDGR
jgi:hypothetical protein